MYFDNADLCLHPCAKLSKCNRSYIIRHIMALSSLSTCAFVWLVVSSNKQPPGIGCEVMLTFTYCVLSAIASLVVISKLAQILPFRLQIRVSEPWEHHRSRVHHLFEVGSWWSGLAWATEIVESIVRSFLENPLVALVARNWKRFFRASVFV